MLDRRPEVGDVCRSHGRAFLDEFRDAVSSRQRRVLRALAQCRTAELGGHVEKCDQCGHQRIAYNSCRNRHCPKCRQSKAAEWLEARSEELLPVEYFHVVFTLPEELSPLALQHPRALYGLLFSCAAETLQVIGRDPRHLGAEIGFLSVLHTWGQTLVHHPHLHCIVPGGGLSPDGKQWISCPRGFFLPVRVLSRYFRRRFLEELERLVSKPALVLRGECQRLRDPEEWGRFLRKLREKNWVVYAKPPFGGPEQVLKYLARYTHKVAISNRRLVSVENDVVTFEWKDYAHSNRRRTMTLAAVEFLRRFLQHVLPERFHRIRHYGFLSNHDRRKALQKCRELLGVPATSSDSLEAEPSCSNASQADESTRCPVCQQGRMIRTELLDPHSGHARLVPTPWDTS